MATSGLWTAEFLDSSVCMKVNDGQRRLYITTPEAYLQADDGWSWQALRQLPIYDASGDEQAAQADSRVIEACWSYNDRLDEMTSAHASFAASHASQWSIRSEHSPHESRFEGERLPSPAKGMHIGHQRAVSLPTSSSAIEDERSVAPKRRVASFETVATMPLTYAQPSLVAAGKRRRISTSPEAERRGAGFTPRWSREPPSPNTADLAGEAQSQGASSRRRGMTPFAYATPHSNSHHAERGDFLGGDGDTEADTDMAVPQIENADDEWEGVQDGMDADGPQGDVNSAVDESEIDEGASYEGQQIYDV